MALSTEVLEICPNCMRENNFMWNIGRDGLQAHCLHCGGRLMLCSECPKKEKDCDYSSDTDRCSQTKE